jgi:hypothetical protein
MDTILKYPRTPHLQGSTLQKGDDLPQASLDELAGKYVVIEEKLDGANCGIRFTSDGTMLLQSRGHYLGGGPREAQWTLFKSWAHTYQSELRALLGDRYILYGEWLYAKHTVWYTHLPHYFFEFDVWDTEEGIFLSTAWRRTLFEDASWIVPVPVVFAGQLPPRTDLVSFVGPSHYIRGDVSQALQERASELGQDPARVLVETDTSGTMEGLYIKVEDENAVVARYKYVRRSFTQMIAEGDDHWHDRPIFPNLLAPDVALF